MKYTLVGLALVFGQPLLAQSPSRDAFIVDYLAREEALYAKYSFNRKIVFAVTMYKIDGENTKLDTTVTTTEISSTESQRSRGTVVHGDGSTPVLLGEMRTGGVTYLLGRGKSADTFGITSHRAVHNPTEAHPGFGSTSPSGYPLSYEDAVYSNTFGAVMRRQAEAKDASRIPRLDSVQSTQLDGKTVFAAKFTSLFNIISTIYLDPANDYAYLGFDSDGSHDPKTRKKGPIKMTGRLTYQASSEGFPIPTKSETWLILPSGKRLLQSVVEISSFEKYTPTADDFDLEKQFGVKPLPLPGSTAALAGGRSWRWLYAVAAVLALVTGGLVVVARRRRSATAT